MKASEELEKYLKNFELIEKRFNISKRKDGLKKNTSDQYKNYLKELDKNNHGETISWIKDSYEQSYSKDSPDYERDVCELVEDKCNRFFNQHPEIKWNRRNKTDYTSALSSLTRCFLSIYDGLFSISLNKFIEDKMLLSMIAETALFVNPRIVEQVVKGEAGYTANKYASADNCTHVRRTNKQPEDLKTMEKEYDGSKHDVYLDSNNTPNYKMKEAIRKGMPFTIKASQFKNYVVCHIWEGAYDPRSFCSLVNLVLVPKAIYGLTDHHDSVKRLLQKRSYCLYNHIEGLKFPFEYLDVPKDFYSPKTKSDADLDELKEYNWREII